MNSGKTRSSLIGIVGCYLIYTAYQLYQGRNDPESTMPLAVMILFIVLFVGAGLALIVLAWRIWRRGEQEEEQRPKENENSLK